MTVLPEKIDMDLRDDNWHSLFRMLDAHNNGVIAIRELRSVVIDSASSLGLTSDEADFLLRDVDQNLDDLIDFPEFCALLAKVKGYQMKRAMFYAAKSVLSKRSQSESYRYLLEYNCFPPPIFMILISIIQIGIYIYYALESDVKFSPVGPVPINSVFILDPHHKYQVWRFFSYMFIHVGYTHLIANVVVQLLLGLPLELVHKFWRIAALYLLGVFTGGILVMAVDSNVYLGGASAGAYALLSAHVSNVIINWSEMEFHWIRAAIFAVLISVDVSVAVYQRYFAAIINKTSYLSHIGGFVAGLLLGIVLLRNLKWKKWETYAWWSCLVAYILLVVVCVVVIYAPGLISS